jgi:hypothetical protein
MSSVRIAVITGLGVLCVSLPLLAHHATATVYDVTEENEVTLVGSVTEVVWRNPHIHIYVDVTDDAGNVVNYAIEGGTPNSLYRRGWRKDDLMPGDMVTIEGAAPSRNGTPRAHLGSITTEDGRQFFSGRN